MNQDQLSRRKVMQLMSLAALGSLAISKTTYSASTYKDSFPFLA
ncbi:MAG: hypothetical protein WCH59_03635 [Chitinophagia bacterium]